MESFQDVYFATKEIIESNQRNLLANALSILTITTKSAGKEGTEKISYEDLVEFWLKQVLPLVFDEDENVKANASEAMKQVMEVIEVSSVHKSLHWPDIKNTIINTYAPKIHKLRDEKQKLWTQIWCLLVSILDREILKGASTINAFLSIVETGFRHSDNNVRTESFMCWRLLIKIFHAYGEITFPKRSKLICIPLKSSLTKSAEAADAKLRTWWYLISCLGNDIEELFNTVVEPFIIFCFASRHGANIAQQFPSVRNLIFTCVSSLFAYDKPNKFLEGMIVKYKVERLAVNPKILITQHWRSLSYAIFEATKLILKCSCDGGEDDEHKFLEIMQLSLIDLLLVQNNTQFTTHFWLELSTIMQDLSETCDHKINTIMLTVGNINSKFDMNFDEKEMYSTTLNNLLKLCILAKPVISPDFLTKCIVNIFSLPEADRLRNDRTRWHRVLVILVNVVLDSNVEHNLEVFQTKLLIWIHLSSTIVVPYLKENVLNYRSKEFCDLVQRWVLWPLQSCIHIAGNCTRPLFATDFSNPWKQMLICEENSAQSRTFLKDLNLVLKDFFAVMRKEEETFVEIFKAYGDAVCKLKTNNNFSHFHEFFELQDLIFSSPVCNKLLNASLNTLQHIVLSLSDQYITTLFETIKPIFAKIVQLDSKGKLEKTFLERWKQSIMKKLRLHSNKQIANQIRNLFKQKDDFVIVPSVSSLDPERLTDLPKSRIKKKAYTPALCNDTSHSEKSAAIKPMKPKKTVIAKDDRTEISIEGMRGKDNETHSENESLIHFSVTQAPKNNTFSSQKPLRTRNSTKVETAKIISTKISDLNKELKHLPENQCPESDSNIIKTTKVRRLNQPEQQQKKQYPVEKTIENEPIHSKVFLKDVSSAIKRKSEKLTKKFDNSEEHCNGIAVEPQSVAKQRVDTSNEVLTLNTSQIINNLPYDVPSVKDISPKNYPIRYQPLSSPAKRRLTDNISPTVHPKPKFLTGRGAQFINMIRNTEPDVSSVNNLPQSPVITHQSIIKPTTKSIPRVTPASGISYVGGTFQTSTPTSSLKSLFSPTSQSSSSIVKRRIRRRYFDDNNADSSSPKRNRFSFHDPCGDKTKSGMKRCLLLDKSPGVFGVGTEPESVLKGRSNEIGKYSSDLNMSNARADMTRKFTSLVTPSTLQYANDSCAADATNISCSERNDVIAKVVTPQDALEEVVQNFSLEELLKKYFEKHTSSHVQMINTLTNFISRCMDSNSKIKSNVLENLSEKHSKDFLNHALQENFSAVVCDRLNSNSVIEYVCAKSKLNLVFRTSLLEKIPDILSNYRLNSERYGLIKKLLENSKLNDDKIFELIECLILTRPQAADVSINESPADSSSNL